MDNDLLNGIKAIVQYDRENGTQGWVTMAAFDSVSMAEKYAARCADGDSPWRYKVVEILDSNE